MSGRHLDQDRCGWGRQPRKPERATRPVFLRPIPTRRPLSCVLHDWAVRLVLALLLVVAMGYVYQCGVELWELLR